MVVAGRARTRGVRLLAALGLALLPAALAAPADAEVFLQAQTTATALHITVTQQPASSIITASLFDDAVAYAAGDFDSGGSSEALAAQAFPGRLVVQGPQLLCSQLFSCPFTPPPYPLLADASYPRRTHDTAQAGGQAIGSGPFVITPLTASATAGADSNVGTTSAGRTSLLTGTPGAIDVGTSSATSAMRTVGDGIAVHLESVLTDVTIAGTVHVDAMHAVDDVVVKPGRRPVDHPSITISGVTVAGQTASIDDRGIHVPGADGPSLTRQLSQSGVVIRTVGAHRTDTATGARSDATALEVDVAIPVSGVPYIPNPLPPLPPPFDQIPQLPGVNANGTYLAHVTLGAVGTAAGFGTEPSFSSGGVVVSSPGAPPAGSTTSAAGPAPLPVGAPPLAAPPAQPPALAPTSGFTGILDALSHTQVETLYAVLALGTLALFIGWRGSVLLRQLRAGAWRRP